jgi:inositol hexakisphosphate/diphosphoinositol-pentakisphosphate kinase
MDIKARSKPMREILTRLVDRMKGAVEIKIFGDKVILDEGECFPWTSLFSTKKDSVHAADVENWPLCDVLISFFSTDFPLDKAIAYAKLRDVYCVNDLIPQALLWDRRLVGRVLDHLGCRPHPGLRCHETGDRRWTRSSRST